MKNLKQGLFFIIMLISVYTPAQKVESSIGAPYRYTNKTFHSKFLTKTENSIVLLRQNYKSTIFYIDYYDFDMKLKGSKEINYDQKGLSVLDIQFSQDQFIILSTHYNKQNHLLTLYGSTGSFEDIQKAQPTKIGQFNTSKIKDTQIQTRYSKDKKQVLISCTYPNEQKMARLNYYVFDLELNQQDFAEIELPLKINDFELVQSGISNKGDLHFITRKKLKRNYKFEFISFFRKDGSMSEKELHFGENIPKYVRLLITDTDVNVVAILSDFNQRVLTNTYFIHLDCQKKAYSEAVFENLTEALSRSSQGRSYDYYMHTVLQSDGTIYVILEYIDTRMSTSYDSFGSAHSTYYYYYNDLVILALDKHGSKKWGYVLPKNQTSINDQGYGLGTGFLTHMGNCLSPSTPILKTPLEKNTNSIM
jgi:hypothetical protein